MDIREQNANVWTSKETIADSAWLKRLRTALGTQYAIQRELGSGGMATVHLALDVKHHRHVAVKVLRWELTSAIGSQRFLREIEIVAQLQHPHILPLFDSGDAEGLLYYVMPYVAGETLRDRLRRETRLPVTTAIALTREVASALAYAHGRDVVHRDIKPENILLTDGHAVVADFGIARAVGLASRSRADDALTRTGIAIGTPAYMSPEQIFGDPSLDARSDIYSLGCVVYEMLAGEAPFTGPESLALRLGGEKPPLSRVRPDVPQRIDAVIDRALAASPGDRWTSAAEFADHLLAASGEGPASPSRAATTARVAEAAAGTYSPQGHSTTKPIRAGVRARTRADRATTAPARITVGRTRERTEVRAAFESVQSGSGLLLSVAGEPGIGKTTFVEDFLAELTSAGETFGIARGRCSERLAGAEAYLPILEALENLVRDDAGETARLMMHRAPTWYAQIAPLSESERSDAQGLAQSRPASQERMKRELSTFLQEASELRPLIVFLDDLHWADISTLDVLTYLAGKFQSMRVLIVTTVRPSELLLSRHPFAAMKLDLQARGMCREISLPFLRLEDIERYLTLQFPGHRFPAKFAALIHSKTEGSPLFMVDLLRYLRDEGLIAHGRRRGALTRSLLDIERNLPESVRSMVQRKIEQLSEDDRRLLGTASVQGQTFDSAAVARTMSIDSADVEERLDKLDRVHAFVQRVREHEFPDRTLTVRYRFVHVFYQNALFAALAPTRRASLSGLVAQALREFYGDQASDIAVELAVLFETAREAEQAAVYFLRAAKNAAKLFANDEAIVLAQRGLALLATLPDSPKRAQQELALNLTLGAPLMAVKGYSATDVQQAFNRARELCEQLGEQSELFPAVWGLWGFYLLRGDLQTARELAAQALRLAQSAASSAMLVQAHLAMGLTLAVRGEIATALEQLNSGIGVYDPQAHRSNLVLFGQDPGVVCLSQAMLVLWLLGFPDQALAHGERAIALAESQSHPQSIAFARHFMGFLRQLRREHEAARDQADAVFAIATEHSLLNWKAWSTILRGWTVAAEGDAQQGIALIREGLATHQAMGAGLSMPRFLLLIAEALRWGGQPDDAVAAVAEGLVWAERTGEKYLEAELYRLEAELTLEGEQASGTSAGESRAAGKERLARALASIDRAITIARAQGSLSLEMRAAMSRCRLIPAGENRDEALAELATLYGRFTEGFDTPDLKEAKLLLENSTRLSVS